MTSFSYSIPSSSNTLHACCIVSQSEILPIMTPTDAIQSLLSYSSIYDVYVHFSKTLIPLRSTTPQTNNRLSIIHIIPKKRKNLFHSLNISEQMNSIRRIHPRRETN